MLIHHNLETVAYSCRSKHRVNQQQARLSRAHADSKPSAACSTAAAASNVSHKPAKTRKAMCAWAAAASSLLAQTTEGRSTASWLTCCPTTLSGQHSTALQLLAGKSDLSNLCACVHRHHSTCTGLHATGDSCGHMLMHCQRAINIRSRHPQCSPIHTKDTHNARTGTTVKSGAYQRKTQVHKESQKTQPTFTGCDRVLHRTCSAFQVADRLSPVV